VVLAPSCLRAIAVLGVKDKRFVSRAKAICEESDRAPTYGELTAIGGRRAAAFGIIGTLAA
jgi:hypothetical protein